MPEEGSDTNVQMLQAEIVRLNKIVQALMNRAEHSTCIQGSDFNLFQTAITLENQVRLRTEELEAARLENEKITRTMIAQAKQAAMGDMIAMIAHQWRQPLAVIGMEINNLTVSIALEEEITIDYLLKHVSTLNKQIEQLAKTIDNFSNYFKPNQSEEQINVENILKSTLDIIGKSLENHAITLTIKNTTYSSLFITKSSLIQVLLNILENAQDALLANKVEQAAITITANETKEAIILSICDIAGGIPKSIMDKIGQPYFTTKQEFNGAGLGLYISRTIVEKHLHGTLTWHNEDKGTCFVIALKLNHEKTAK